MKAVADGQLAVTSTAIYTGVGDLPSAVVSLFNTSSSLTQTILMTLTRSGSSARRIGRWVLAPNEGVTIDGIPIGNGDVLKCSTTTATTVDYVVSITSGDRPRMLSVSWDATGAIKQVNSGVGATIGVTGTVTAGNLTTAGLVQEASLSPTYTATINLAAITTNKVLIAGVNGTSATCTLNCIAVAPAGSQLIVETTADGSGNVTVTFGTHFRVTTATQVTTTSKISEVVFIGDGTNWNEIARNTAMT